MPYVELGYMFLEIIVEEGGGGGRVGMRRCNMRGCLPLTSALIFRVDRTTITSVFDAVFSTIIIIL